MAGNLSLELHVLTARLDRAADRILRAEYNISYRRFLALVLVAELSATTQRALAEGLGVTEPSVSRMTGVLTEAGYLDVQPDPAGGHRRRLSLSPKGSQLVAAGRHTLEARFAVLVEASGVSYAEYQGQTQRLLATLTRAQDQLPK